jgi:anti-repressor protein
MEIKDLTVKQVNFNGDNLLAVKDNATGKVHVAVYYVCKGLKLDENQTKVQRDKINSDIVLSKGGRKISIPTNGGIQDVLCLELEFLPLWLAKINANIIDNPEIQDKLIEYQLKAKDVLAAEFIGQAPKLPQTFAEALRLAADLEEEKEREKQGRIEAENKVTILAPKAQSFDTFMNAEGNLTIEETAKTLNIEGVGRNNLFKVLVTIGVLFRKGESYEAYQKYVDAGYFVHKQNPVKMGAKIEQRTQVFTTPKGLDWLTRKLAAEGYRVDKQMALV